MFRVYYRDPHVIKPKWRLLAAFMWLADATHYSHSKHDPKNYHIKIMHGKKNVRVFDVR